jgi:hypothetical protein
MYISIDQDKLASKESTSEGFVVRFFRSDESSWVANFSRGTTDFNAVFDFPKTDTTIIIAGGAGYVMHRDQTKPINTFGFGIKAALLSDGQEVVAADYTDIKVISNNGLVWTSDRVSWHGIKELSIQGNIVRGKANDLEGWNDFTLDLKTRQGSGSSWRIEGS